MKERREDQPLSDDVRFLGELLGEVLREQAGLPVYEVEERVRTLAIKRRRGSPRERKTATAELSKFLRGLDLETAEAVIRAFSIYFQLVNVAEQHHRLRRRRAHAKDKTPQEGSLIARMQEAKEAGISADAIRTTLRSLEVTLTFTAHPTQAMRRTVLEKLGRIFHALECRDRMDMTPGELESLNRELKDQIVALWQTDELRHERPTVGDEVKTVMWYLESVLWDLVAQLPDRLERAFERVFDEPLALQCSPLRLHSWVGGDMDGNPLVTAEVLEDSLRAYQTAGLRRLVAQVEALGASLSASNRYVEVPTELLASIERDARELTDLAEKDRSRTAGEPWRRKLRFMETRLRGTLDDAERRRAWSRNRTGPEPELTAHAYRTPAALEGDLQVIARSLETAKGAGVPEAKAVLEQVRALGFQLAELEMRMPSEDVRDAAENLNGTPKTEGGKRVVESLRRVARLQAEAGEAICRTLILSQATGSNDVLNALACAKHAGLWDNRRHCATVDVVPLFEALGSLNDSPRVLRELLADPAYGPHLRARGAQEVMIGYSDSAKEVGLIAARAALLRAQTELPRLAREAGVPLRIFHGRGESVARGGGPAQLAILALPHGSVAGKYKATEQGEAIDHKYARPELAMRTVELVLGGVLLHTLAIEERPKPQDDAAFRSAFDELGELGRKAFQSFVYEDPRFMGLYESVTPLDEISHLPIGSRPSKRKAGGLESLRAIPWVFAWTQNRAIVPGWFGVGSALAGFGGKAKGRALLKRMYAEWPYFRVMLDSVEMVLAKTDMDIARRYVEELADSDGKKLWKRVEDEHALTLSWVMKVTGKKMLLEENAALRKSIALRNPYVDPMSLLQIELLKRKREGEEDVSRPLLLTLAGISQGLRNTG
ncbi:MAG: phosphoenolpyruvate carboxylase [Myxococcaceae bacterium]